LAGFVFFVLTAPIAAHLLARAAHKAGHRLRPPSVRDELLTREQIAIRGYRKKG